MRIRALLLVVIGMAMVPPVRVIASDAQPTSKAAALELERYEDKENGFVLDSPKGWDTIGQIGGSLAMFFHAGEPEDKAADTITVMKVHSADPTKLDDVLDQMLPVLKVQFRDFKMTENTGSKLAGLPARSIVFTAEKIADEVKVRVVVCLVGQDIYGLMFQTVPRKYERLTPTFDAVLKSFEFTKKAK